MESLFTLVGMNGQMTLLTAAERDAAMDERARLEAAADRVEQVTRILERRRLARIARATLEERDRDYRERAAEAATIAPW